MTAVTVIRSPESTELKGRPVLFLAGPIQGSEDWQQNAAWTVSSTWKGEDLVVANPRRTGPFSPDNFNEQVDWEQIYLNQALVRGLVLFWLVRQTVPMDPPTRAYAQTSRFEIGYVVGQLRRALNWGMAGYCPLAVGIDPRFPGGQYISHTLNKEFMGKVVVQRTLSATVDIALSTLSTMLSETPGE